MCGIGLVIGSSSENLKVYLSRLVGSQKHRGPDHSQTLICKSNFGEEIGFAHNRLSLIDLSSKGNQPMIDEISKNVIVFNGEIYNYKEIRNELIRKGEKFKSSSDSEVLLKAYRHFGINVLIKKIKGMYAFIIWDQRKSEAIIVRDKIGIKPLYYSYNDGIFACASESSALIKSKLSSKKLSRSGLDSYLAYGSVQPPLTIYEGIKCLLPGHALIIKSNRIIVSQINLWTNDNNNKEINSLENILIKAVEQHICADVPVGVFLSGGYDSTLLAFLASKFLKKPIKTFTLNFPEEPSSSEGDKAKRIAEKLKTDHTTIDIRKEDLFNILPKYFNVMDQPSDDGLNVFMISQAVAKHGIKACFHGVGGDEIFGGYPSFKQVPVLQKLKIFPQFIRSFISCFLNEDNITHSKIKSLLLSDLSLINTFLIRRQSFSFNQRKLILNEKPPLGQYGMPEEWISFFKSKLNIRNSNFASISQLELFHYCSNKLLVDSDVMSMSCGLELRVPLLDIDFININQNTKATYIKNSKKEIMKNFNGFPHELMSNVKSGFTLPFDKWLLNFNRNELNDIIDILHTKFALNKNILYKILIKEDISGKYSWLRSLQLISLAKWGESKL